MTIRPGRGAPALLLALLGCGGGTVAPRPAPSGPPTSYAAGNAYFGADSLIEYLAGDLPLIFAAPHGGERRPAGMPARTAATCGGEATTVRDTGTQELARAIRAAFHARTGRWPHIVINRLHRDRLDANRPLAEAACGDARAERAWTEFQGFVETATARAGADHAAGFFTDLHGHGHPVQRLELGYLIAPDVLRRDDAALDADPAVERAASVRAFSEASPLSFADALRGPTSLGTLLGEAGYPSVPSRQDPAPREGQVYFTGGYNTGRHGCAAGGRICAVQIEAHLAGVRDTPEHRARFAAALVDVYVRWLAQFGVTL